MIIIFGAPGAGKSAQGQLLAKKYGWSWISSRDLMLSLKDRDISLALTHGMPIDLEKSVAIMRDTVQHLDFDSDKIAILDGFPTNASQIYWLIENGYLEKIKGVINLRVPRGILWKRLLDRGRIDDTRVAIERRESLYDRAIHGMLHILKTNNVRIADIDGSHTEEDVLARIEEVLAGWDIIEKKSYEKTTKIL